MMLMTLEDLILEVNRRGLRLNNLYQLPPDGRRWQANITDGEKFWEFGRGETAIEALQAALRITATEAPTLGISPPKPVPIRRGRTEDLSI